jgi:hypothetical protein
MRTQALGKKAMINKRIQKGFMLACFGGTYAYLCHIVYQPLNADVMAIAQNDVEKIVFAGITPTVFVIAGLIFGLSLAVLKME